MPLNNRRSEAIATRGAVQHRSFNQSLEGLRGVAAVLVVLAHTLPNAGGFTLGVDIFFVLSGFLITRLVVEELAQRGTVSLRSFYIRRGFRLFPALFVFLIIALMWAQVFAPASGVQILHSTVLSSLLYVENWHIVAVGGVGGAGLIRDPVAQAWSLSVEEQFYLLWPLLLVVAWKWKGQRAALIVAACGLTLAVAERVGLTLFGATVVRVYMGSDTRADQLLAGCCVALLAQCRLLPNIPKLAAIFALLGILAIGLHPLPLIYQLTATTFLGGVLVAGLSQHQLWLLSSLPARWLGQRSYALYLWHPFIGVIFFYQLRLSDGWAMLGCVLLTSLFIAHATHRFVEAPLREVGRRLTDPAAVAVPGDPLQTRMRGAVARLSSVPPRVGIPFGRQSH
jgi:peptidoglycan/LPS O-acetylase OafA/YrhL